MNTPALRFRLDTEKPHTEEQAHGDGRKASPTVAHTRESWDSRI